MPPSEASAPGSIGKNRPWSRRYSLSCLRVTPGSTTQSRSSAWTASMRFMRVRSIDMPPTRRVDLAFERRAGAERDHRHAVCGADAHDLLHVVGRLREHHRVGRLVGEPGRGVAVLLAHACEVTTRLPNAAVSFGDGRGMARLAESGFSDILQRLHKAFRRLISRNVARVRRGCQPQTA